MCVAQALLSGHLFELLVQGCLKSLGHTSKDNACKFKGFSFRFSMLAIVVGEKPPPKFRWKTPKAGRVLHRGGVFSPKLGGFVGGGGGPSFFFGCEILFFSTYLFFSVQKKISH